ncbi:hypothetical protein Tco_0335389 [Tanacetum coccineum]
MATNEETNVAGTDTRPPMLVENDYESWKIRIHSTSKEDMGNVEMLMQGSGGLHQQRKEDLFDELRTFRAIGNESIHDYFERFHKLVTDMTDYSALKSLLTQ